MIDNITPEPQWQRSSFCGTSTCVEVAKVDDTVLVRDSKNPGGRPLAFSKADWHGFLRGIATGDYRAG